MKKKVLLTSMMSIAMLASIASGATYALFTAEDSTNIAVTAGKVAVDAYVDENSLKTYSMGVLQTYGTFENGGFAKFDEKSNLKLDLLTPGDKANFIVKVDNNSNVNIKYQITLAMEGELAPALVSKVTIDGKEYSLIDGKTGYIDLAARKDIPDVTIDIELPVEAGNEYQEKSANITVKVEALQGNAPTVDEWDGNVDISWFTANPAATEFELSSAEALAGLAALVDNDSTSLSKARGIDTLPDEYDLSGKTFKLTSDVDLYIPGEEEPATFDPIGDDVAFTGTFDGQGHTISNLYQSGWALGYEWEVYGSIGLFGNVKDATIKNVKLSGFESFVEGGDVGGITGSATGTCVFENITIEDSVFATYNNGNGGIIGWSGAGHYTFKNIKIADDVVLAGLWGSFDSSIGGVVGQGEPGATYNFENVDVACRLDVYNDCTASYDYYNYRMCGMLIGRLKETTTIDGVNYPDVTKYDINCKNVTVTYGEWANYHYCEPTPADLNGGRGMRVEPGYSYSGLPEDYDHSQCVDNHLNLIEFDQIFGGDQLGVKGLKSYDGVTVVYNNK